MPKYHVALPYHCSVFVTVEADDEFEAELKALDEVSPSVCCHCSERVEMGEFNDDAADVISVKKLEEKESYESRAFQCDLRDSAGE